MSRIPINLCTAAVLPLPTNIKLSNSSFPLQALFTVSLVKHHVCPI